MPIYAYRCERCGHELDALQKISEPVLTDCPACGEASLQKKLTAPGFQLKGSGWYATDFKGGAKPAAKAEGGESKSGGEKAGGEKKSEGAASAAPACGTGSCPACQ